MIDLNNLIDLFPYYYKENDSYKVDGKGLLERFLNICGDYFQRHPLADLDNFLEILDINKTNIIFVQNFWKFFGELPFAQGPIVDSEQFIKTFDGFNLEEAIRLSTRTTQPYTGKDSLDYRSIIKYAVSLFKIRGTEKFFEVMFRLYGLQVTITYPEGRNPFKEDYIPKFNSEDTVFDEARFDKYYQYKQTFEVTFTIQPPTSLTNQTQVLSFANQIKAFIDRFIPFYIKPDIQVSGWNSLNKVKLTVTPPKDNPNLILGLDESLSLEVKVVPFVSGSTFPSLAYQVAVTEPNVAPKKEDWMSQHTDPIYKVVAGNKDYHFRAIADPDTVVMKHISEQYTRVQYMIWVDSPRKAEDRILSNKKTSIDVVVKAVGYTYTYRDGNLINTDTNYPSINWDTAPEGTNKTYPNGKGGISVKVDYYGTQVFSISSFPAKKASVYIGVTEDYKKELNTLELSVDPPYLFIQDGGTRPGTIKEDGTLTAGTYGSEDGENWYPHEYETSFRVTNREGQEQPLATITDVNNALKTYASGDTFIPPTKGTSSYTFKATQGGKESNTVTLYVKTNTTINTKPTYKSIQVLPNPLGFIYSSGSQTKTLEGTLVLTGLTKPVAQSFSPQVTVFNSLDKSTHSVNALFQSYTNQGATYNFTYSHTINSEREHELKFYPTENPNISDTIPVRIVVSTTDVYMQAFDRLDQWTVNDVGADEDAIANRRGKDLTFTAKEGTGNNIARFTFEGNYLGNITDSSGNTYEVGSEEPISFEVKGDKDLTFTADDVTLTLHLKDFAGVVTISCHPTEATINESTPSVKTEVTGSTNKSDKFRFTIDGQSSIREINNNGVYEFITSDVGTHTFTAVDDPSQVAYFDVGNDMPDFQVAPSGLAWEANNTEGKVVEIYLPVTATVTITIEDETLVGGIPTSSQL